MKIIIDIPERVYTYLTKECSGLVDDGSDSILLHLAKGVIQGTVLPKGHGDLIDREEVNNALEREVHTEAQLGEADEEYLEGVRNSYAIVRDIPTVIPADKGEE